MENDVLYNRIMKKVTEMIAEAGGGSSLPAVTADDNGDVLTVVSGEWAKATPSGIPSGLCTVTEETLDKSYNDILNMMASGIIPYITKPGVDNSNYTTTYTLMWTYEYPDPNDFACSIMFYGYDDTIDEWQMVYFAQTDPDALMMLD